MQHRGPSAASTLPRVCSATRGRAPAEPGFGKSRVEQQRRSELELGLREQDGRDPPVNGASPSHRGLICDAAVLEGGAQQKREPRAVGDHIARVFEMRHADGVVPVVEQIFRRDLIPLARHGAPAQRRLDEIHRLAHGVPERFKVPTSLRCASSMEMVTDGMTASLIPDAASSDAMIVRLEERRLHQIWRSLRGWPSGLAM